MKINKKPRCKKCGKKMIWADTSDYGNCDLYEEYVCPNCEPKWRYTLIKKQRFKMLKKWLKKKLHLN